VTTDARGSAEAARRVPGELLLSEEPVALGLQTGHLLSLGDRVIDVIRLLDHTAQTWAGNQQPRGIESSQDRLVLVSGAVMKGAVEDGDGMPGEVQVVLTKPVRAEICSPVRLSRPGAATR
jgi:hypothetical protein